MRIEPLCPESGIGARIREIDLEGGLSASEWQEIDATWNRYHALLFPDQKNLSTEGQVAFLDHFGPVLEERMPGEFHSFVSNNDGKGLDEMTDGYREGPLTPHMDYTYTPYPADVISLLATELPEGGSTTSFYNNVRALEVMPATLRSELADYSIFCAHDLAEMKPDVRLYLEGRTDPAAPTQSHVWPLIRKHPHKPGIETLVCTLQQTERIIELEGPGAGEGEDRDAASRAKLGEIFDEYLYASDNEYVHPWQIGDLIVWDNIALQHGRAACPRTRGARTFRRVATCSAGNAIHETVKFLGLADSSVAFSS